MPEAVVLSGVQLGFGHGSGRVEALRGVDLAIKAGEMTLITGPSGSGKTTLLSVIGALVRPDAGSVTVGGDELTAFDETKLTEYRRNHIGFVFQAFRLIKTLSAAENVAQSLHLRHGGKRKALMEQAVANLVNVGLGPKANLRPDALSGGEKQRVAIARALAHAPTLVLADEPTASLDAANGLRTIELLRDVAKAPGRTVIVVSHDERVRPFMDRIVNVVDGRVLVREGLVECD